MAPTDVPPSSRPLWHAILARDPRRTPLWQRLIVAVAITVLAAWLRTVLAPAESGGRFITFSLAAALSALYGGFRAGMLSTLAGMVLANYFLVKPYGTLAIDNPVEAFWLNLLHLLTQVVVVGSIALMQERNRKLEDAMAQAQRNQQRFLDTFEHAASGISHVAPDGTLLRVNQSFCDIVGYSADELHHLRFQDITHPDDVAPDVALLLDALAGRRTSYTLEKRYRHKQGHWVWVQLTVALIRHADGSPNHFISVVQDLSTLKDIEADLQRSQTLLNQAQKLARVGAWQADLATQRIQGIPRGMTFLDMPASEYSFDELLALIHPDDRPRVQRLWPQAVKGTREYEIEYRVVRQGGECWHAVKAVFERDEQGRALSALGVTQDITVRKRIELEIQQLNASLEQRIKDRTGELQRAYDELESYSYAVAHDLRSPLRVINGFAMAVQDDNPGLDEGSRQHLRRIMGASAKMGKIIDGLLQISQFVRSEVQRHPVDLSAIATRQLEDMAAAQPERQVRWAVEPGLLAQADSPLLEALLQNLLHNAWKYTARQEQAVIRVWGETLDGQRFFCVGDNGVGFDMARSAKLFQPFQRLHMPQEFEGLGIGLATAWRIVQRHGGELRAEAAPGAGATFRFSLGAEA